MRHNKVFSIYDCDDIKEIEYVNDFPKSVLKCITKYREGDGGGVA